MSRKHLVSTKRSTSLIIMILIIIIIIIIIVVIIIVTLIGSSSYKIVIILIIILITEVKGFAGLIFLFAFTTGKSRFVNEGNTRIAKSSKQQS